MKKNIVLGLICLFALCIIIIGYYILGNNSSYSKEDAEKFKNDYEHLNGLVNENNNKEYLVLNIPKKNPFIYSDYKEIIETLSSTGIIYFGFPECPWCRNMVSVLLDAAKESKIGKIYYLNNLDTRDIRKLNDKGKVIIEKEGTDEYYQLLKKLGTDFTEEYDGLNDSNIRRIYFPTVIFVKNGKVLDAVVGTVDSQEDPYLPLTNTQKEELKTIYMNLMKQIS